MLYFKHILINRVGQSLWLKEQGMGFNPAPGF
jgi:hypothetical protein